MPLTHAVAECAFEKLGCYGDDPTLDGFDVLEACLDESVAMNACTACAVKPLDDDACTQCSKASCCAERTAAHGDKVTVSFSVCAHDCTDQTCLDACEAANPEATEKILALEACEMTNCPEAC